MSARAAVCILLSMAAGHVGAATPEPPIPATKPTATTVRGQAAETEKAPVRKPAPRPTPKARKQPASPTPAGLDRQALGLGCSSGED